MLQQLALKVEDRKAVGTFLQSSGAGVTVGSWPLA